MRFFVQDNSNNDDNPEDAANLGFQIGLGVVGSLCASVSLTLTFAVCAICVCKTLRNNAFRRDLTSEERQAIITPNRNDNRTIDEIATDLYGSIGIEEKIPLKI